MSEGSELDVCRDELEAAAERERWTRALLCEGMTPSHPDWTAADAVDYNARLSEWRAAAAEVTAALSRLAAAEEHVAADDAA